MEAGRFRGGEMMRPVVLALLKVWGLPDVEVLN
jgi:hypothetical protein